MASVSVYIFLSQQINCHNNSSSHVNAVLAEKLCVEELGRIDVELWKQLLEKSNYWFCVLQRLVDVTLTLASFNVAFRGHREEVSSLGNLLAMVTLLAQYDPALKALVKKPDGSVRCLSHEWNNFTEYVEGHQ